MKVTKILAVLMVVVMLTGLMGSVNVYAKEYLGPEKPVFHVKAHKDGSKIKITIDKTQDAEDYYIEGYKEEESAYYKGYRGEYTEETSYSFTLEEDGTRKRNISVELPQGKYVVYVTANSTNKNGVRYEIEGEPQEVVLNKPFKGSGYADTYDFSGVKAGDIIKFGAYEQDGNFENGKEPIEWIVLARSKKYLFVVSKKLLDSLPYHIDQEIVTWETCTLRKWLNKKFYKAAFNDAEKALIKKANIKNDNSDWDVIDGGNDTRDRVFLLSNSEIKKYDKALEALEQYADTSFKVCEPTAYAMSCGLYGGSWWTRTPSDYLRDQSFVGSDGYLWNVGTCQWYYGWDDFFGVRPAMYIRVE